MGKITRHEFLGSRLLVVILCMTVIGIPIAVIHLIEGLVTIEEEIPDPTAFMEAYRRKNP